MRPILFFIALPSILLAGSNPRTAVAVRTPTPPKIDGALNETVWQLAKPIIDFTQHDPVEGNPPSQRTEIRILYDDDAVYFGCTMYDTDPSKIVARLARRDDEVLSDYISIRIDSYHDHQTDFAFTVNASGSKVDILQSIDGTQDDASWDAVWDVQTQVTGEGWVAEMKIPFAALRFPDREEQEWGIEFIRKIARNRESDYWVMIGKAESGFTSKFGHLVGIRGIKSPTDVELLPFTVADGRFMPVSPGFPDGHDFKSEAGLDLKYKPVGGMTVDATLNPDFGQVEADPAVLNLTTIETFYPEKRPFFIEGSQILHFTTFGGDFGPGLFYSRRIGKALNIQPPPGGFVLDPPRSATILGAAKVSGKTSNGLSLGILEAMTREEHATFVDSAGVRSDQIVEPFSNFSLIRLRQDLFENSNVGMMVTSVNREGWLPAYTGGLDWNLKFMDNTYRIDGFLAASHTTSGIDQSVIIPIGERITGSAGRITFAKDAGKHWQGSFSADFTSKQFNINDIGFFRRPNDHGYVTTVSYKEDLPQDWRQFWIVNVLHHYRTNFDGVELFNSVISAGNLTFTNYWQIGYQIEGDWGLYDDRETRGNGLFNRPPRRTFLLLAGSDPREPVVLNVFWTFGNDSRRMKLSSLSVELELKLASNVTLDLSSTRAATNNELAWVANIPDTLVSPNLVSVFGDRSTETWDITTRGTFVFARDLTLQVYFQYFNAKFKYENLARMISSDGFLGYAPSGFNTPNLNRLFFNSNVVLRWEYLPGSTMYLVWSHARNGLNGDFSTTFGDSFSRTFALPSDNAIILKISYWLSL